MKENGFNYGAIDQDLENSYNRPLDIEKELRRGFIRKVYSLVLLQLLITAICCAISMTNKDVAYFQLHNYALRIAVVIVSIIICLVLTCFNNIARQVPLNYILFFVFTACESYLVSYACLIAHNPKIVLMAATMTCALVLTLTIYACLTDTDFTVLGGILFCCSMGLLMFSIFALFTENKMIHVIISCVSVILFSIYLIYDTQLLLGRHSYKLDYDDYIVGALMIYVDIVVIFMDILGLIRN